MLETLDLGTSVAMLEPRQHTESLFALLVEYLELIEAVRSSRRIKVFSETVHPEVGRTGIDSGSCACTRSS
jgi:hypothetical protein